ncbi:MAG: sigma-54 dependent transcriptional regulator [Vicingaceae bacterium]
MKDPVNSRLLILDDDPNILDSMSMVFEDRIKSVITLNDPAKVLSQLKEYQADLLIMDMNYSRGAVDGKEGLELLRSIRESGFDLPVIVMTAYGEIDLVVKCMRAGAIDFIQKPWSNQRLLITVSNALRLKQTENEVASLKVMNQYYQEESNVVAKDDFGMVGTSNAMRMVRDKIVRVAESDANVLILGENGTGKELVARAIHNLSNRKNEPFIKIDLGSIHEQLFESEMFGAKKGAYTGLQEEKIGRITLADHGTLFLDEIGNMPLSMQTKMLSVLQNREVIQVGSTEATQVNVRLVSATNLPMANLFDDNTFRQDLLYRINTVEIQIPPLRERVEDIPELFAFFKNHYESKYQAKDLAVNSDVLQKAENYNWPGNVRELQHAVERAVLMCTDGKIKSSDLLPSRPQSKSNDKGLDLNLEGMEIRLIEQALRLHNGSVTKASKELGLSRTALYRRLEKYNL